MRQIWRESQEWTCRSSSCSILDAAFLTMPVFHISFKFFPLPSHPLTGWCMKANSEPATEVATAWAPGVGREGSLHDFSSSIHYHIPQKYYGSRHLLCSSAFYTTLQMSHFIWKRNKPPRTKYMEQSQDGFKANTVANNHFRCVVLFQLHKTGVEIKPDFS